MKKLLCILLMLLTLLGCAAAPAETTVPAATVPETIVPETTIPETTIPETTVPETTVPETTVPETTVPEPTVPPTTEAPGDFLPEDCTVEEVWTWFEEVVLHMEYSDGTGDPSRVQKWLSPIRCRIYGEPTEEDMAVLEQFFAELNQVPGFPGIAFAAEDELENMTLNFLGPERFTEEFGEVVDWEDAWGATQFWYYTDTNELYDGRIGYRTDIGQTERSSILLEEIVNTLGISDTELREDSIVYQYSNENLSLSDTDWLILKLLYHPDVECGMNAEECRAVIEDLCK